MKPVTGALALLFAYLPSALHGQLTLNEDFESSSPGNSAVPVGWALVETAGTATYATSSAGFGSNGNAGSVGLAGQVSATVGVGGNGLPGALLVNTTAIDLSNAVSGTFDFLMPNEANFDDVGFIIGDVANGITGTSAGELLYARITEGNPNALGGIIQDGTSNGTSDALTSESAIISDETWYRATVTWTPTSGTTGGFSITINDFTTDVLTVGVTGFTFDSETAQIGFGSINDTIRFDNVDFTYTPAAPDLDPPAALNLKIVSAGHTENTDLVLTGPASTPYFIFRSSDLKGPIYRKRWEQRFAGLFPSSASKIPLQESMPDEDRVFYIASDEEPRAKIMCVGDSITEGGTGYFISRPALNSRLIAAGYRFEFVGSKTNTRQGVTLKHEGYAGKNATQIANLLSGTFPDNIADIVLIHVGHNYFADVQGEASILNEVETATRSIIDTARTHNPDVIILLAQVITSSKLPKYSYIPALNLRLADLATDLDSPEQPVIIVNQADGWDPVADTVDDQVHPTQAGATKMANKWFETLQPLLD